ncbi:MAG: thioesterase family protein [Myxococcota bacterium]|nr:thioesterase family protein [Myxococcota bacterium]
MGDLAIDTELEATDAERGSFRARISRDWEIWGPNGGYLAVIALRAAGLCAKAPRPASFAGHFLSVGRFEEAEVEVRPIKLGRRSESFAVTIAQADRLLFHGLVRSADEAPGLEHDVSERPDVPGPEGLKPIQELVPDDADGPPYPFWNNFDIRPIWPERVNEPPTAREPVFREWYRLTPRPTFDDPWLEAGRALLMIDTASWIAACQPHPNAPFTAPNLDVTAWFHQQDPDSEWLLMDHQCDVAKGGLMGTHGRIWSASGKLLASGGAQLMCVPNPGRGR